jgi:hypothetical protein
VRRKRTFDERLECSSRSIKGQGIANETMGGMMIQVNSAQFPHKLVRIEIAPEFPGCNHFVRELRELAAPPFFHGEEPLTDEIGPRSVVEFEHAGSNRTSSSQPSFLSPAKPAQDDGAETCESGRVLHGGLYEAYKTYPGGFLKQLKLHFAFRLEMSEQPAFGHARLLR